MKPKDGDFDVEDRIKAHSHLYDLQHGKIQVSKDVIFEEEK